MHKVALSLFVIAASGAYVWDQARQQDAAPVDALLAGVAAAPTAAARTAASSVGPIKSQSAASTDCPPKVPEPAPAETQVAAAPRPRIAIAKAAMKTVARQSMSDGTYTGPTTDAYYGPMQIEAVVQGGRIVTLRALQYPSDRRTSLAINRQALPMLRDEVMAAQSADVDIITGATLTSEAFIRSLRGALAQAGQ